MAEKKFTNELKQTFDYIRNNILKQYDCDKITTEYFILSILENTESVANKVLSKIMLHDSIEEAKMHFYQWLSQNARSFGGNKEYDEVFDRSIKNANVLAIQQKSRTINSGHVLLSVINNNAEINKYFRSLGVTVNQINTQVIEETNMINEEEKAKNNENFVNEKPVKHNKKPKKEEVQQPTSHTIIIGDGNDAIVAALTQHMTKTNVIGECERTFINLNNKASSFQIDEICGNDKIYQEIFNILSKRNKNNVIITGKSGVGKTETIRNLANRIVNGKVPKVFSDKILLEVDFGALFANTGMRGAFEAKLKAIMTDATQKANYIFFIDSLDTILNTKFNETDVESFIESVMKEKKIMLVCTCSEKGYSKQIGDYPEWERYFEKITMDEPNDEECKNILKYHSEKLETFHNVKYDDDVFDTCIKYCRRYITERCLPDSAIDILDKTGAKISLNEVEDENIKTARQKLLEIRKEKERLKISSSNKDYNKLDDLTKEEINLQSILNYAIKSYNLTKQPFTITSDDIKETISEKTNIPLKDLSADDKEKLKNLNERIKKVVIGQDEAVDTVCQAIKRQRLGISNPNKPVVFFFGGSTGVGKTLLCKTIAKELWGDEKQLIRLDMSEYSEVTSVTKIYGAPPSYVGYNDSGSLVDKLKEKKHCILLLDEIEKACDKVYNVFLQLFDEGRLSDSKGNTIDCRNMIIIMTSNIAAKQIIDNKPIGFINNKQDNQKQIIEKELKKQFNPEFLNRIDEIIYFNKLNNNNIKQIINNEIKNIEVIINSIGCYFDKNIYDDDFVEYIINSLKGEEEYGARPIKRKLQVLMVDKISNKIIEDDLKKSRFFQKNDFMSE